MIARRMNILCTKTKRSADGDGDGDKKRECNLISSLCSRVSRDSSRVAGHGSGCSELAD